MKTEFRNRAFLPVVLPLAILLGIGAVVGLVALIFLFVDRQGAIAVAFLAAAGVLVAVALATSQDRLDGPHKGAVALAGVAPVAIGGLIAAGALGGLSDESRNINVEPATPQFVFEGILEDTPVLAAESLNSFCIDEGGGCQDTHEWSFTYQEAERIAYAFDNRDTNEHNLQIHAIPADQLPSPDGDALPLDLVEDTPQITPGSVPTFAGPQAQTYEWTPPTEEEATGEEGAPVAIPQQAYFVCTIHSSAMWGVVEITPEG